MWTMLALLGSIAATDFANDYNDSPAHAHERQAQRDLDRIDRQIERLEHALKGANAERDFWASGKTSGIGGGGRVDGIGEGRR